MCYAAYLFFKENMINFERKKKKIIGHELAISMQFRGQINFYEIGGKIPKIFDPGNLAYYCLCIFSEVLDFAR